MSVGKRPRASVGGQISVLLTATPMYSTVEPTGRGDFRRMLLRTPGLGRRRRRGGWSRFRRIRVAPEHEGPAHHRDADAWSEYAGALDGMGQDGEAACIHALGIKGLATLRDDERLRFFVIPFEIQEGT